MIQVEEQSTRPEYSAGVSGDGQEWVRERERERERRYEEREHATYDAIRESRRRYHQQRTPQHGLNQYSMRTKPCNLGGR